MKGEIMCTIECWLYEYNGRPANARTSRAGGTTNMIADELSRPSSRRKEMNRLADPGLPLYAGTSGWAYSIWKPEFYPKDVAAKNFLKFYATKLNAVEVNYTFRRLLSEKAAESWMNDVGPDFKFVPKANQYITHMRRLKNAERAAGAISATLEPL